ATPVSQGCVTSQTYASLLALRRLRCVVLHLYLKTYCTPCASRVDDSGVKLDRWRSSSDSESGHGRMLMPSSQIGQRQPGLGFDQAQQALHLLIVLLKRQRWFGRRGILQGSVGHVPTHADPSHRVVCPGKLVPNWLPVPRLAGTDREEF